MGFLPASTKDILNLHSLGDTEDEVTGTFLPLEPIEPVQFELPDLNKLGYYGPCHMLRDAVRLSFHSSAGPFRCTVICDNHISRSGHLEYKLWNVNCD